MNAPHLPDRVLDAPIIAADGAKVSATPYTWRDPETIPVRPWVFGRWLLGKSLACVIAPGGVGKSTLLASIALSLATGRTFLGKSVHGGPKRVWLWNLEDDLDELSRSIQAAAQFHRIDPDEVKGRLFVDSAMAGAGLCTALEDEGKFILRTPIYEAVLAELTARKIDVLFIDPFVSSHQVDENANTKIDRIAKAWSRVAQDAGCVIVLVHHTSKAGAKEVTAMSSRGAVALINAARSTLTINRMEEAEATRLGITEDESRRYIRVQDDKHNRAPAEKAEWFKLESVDLGNGPPGDLLGGDSVAVARRWIPPDPFENVTSADLKAVQLAIDGGEWRADPQAHAWAGNAVAEVLGLQLDKPQDKAKAKQLLKTWVRNGAFKEVTRPDGKRQPRKFLEVGNWVDAQPSTGGAGQGGDG